MNGVSREGRGEWRGVDVWEAWRYRKCWADVGDWSDGEDDDEGDGGRLMQVSQRKQRK